MREIDHIRVKHQQGFLDGIKAQLEEFLKRNRDDFLKFREREIRAWGKDIDLLNSLKLYILAKKTIDPRSEILSQIREINRHVDIHKKQNTGICESQLRQDWTVRHAASWRAHRTLEIIYILTQYQDRFLEIVSP
jgi:hypothetical protein